MSRNKFLTRRKRAKKVGKKIGKGRNEKAKKK
jgi:hypothetical protein